MLLKFVYIEDKSEKEMVVRQYPNLAGSISDRFLDDETIVFVTDRLPPTVTDMGLMYIPVSQLESIYPIISQFIDELGKGGNTKETANNLVEALTGGQNGSGH